MTPLRNAVGLVDSHPGYVNVSQLRQESGRPETLGADVYEFVVTTLRPTEYLLLFTLRDTAYV